MLITKCSKYDLYTIIFNIRKNGKKEFKQPVRKDLVSKHYNDYPTV